MPVGAARLVDTQARRAPGDTLVGSFLASFLDAFLASLVYTFLEHFWRQNDSKNGSRMASKSDMFWAQFLYRFFRVLGALWVPLRSFLRPPNALFGGLWTPKTLKNLWFFEVFAKASLLSP